MASQRKALAIRESTARTQPLIISGFK
jgi:hypothetical protein